VDKKTRYIGTHHYSGTIIKSPPPLNSSTQLV